MSGARLAAAVGLGLLGVVVAAVLAGRQHGPFARPEAAPLLLVDATATALDTVRLGDRRVTATLNGRVAAVDPTGTVWLDTGEDAFPLRFPEAVSLGVEDRALVVGRLRGRGGERWVEVDGWSTVTGQPQ